MTAVILTSGGTELSDLGPDACALQHDLRSAAFTYGVDAGWWREALWDFPFVYIAVAAAERDGAPGEFTFQFECTKYPHEAPLSVLWDPEAKAPLALANRPTGRDQVGLVFRTDWENGRYLYTPFDRYALQTHPDWAAKHGRSAWKPTFAISDYLTHLHDLLDSRSYTGLAGA